LRYSLSYRDLEEMMMERGLSLDHTTIYRWVQSIRKKDIERLAVRFGNRQAWIIRARVVDLLYIYT